jgi:hypothetical protein
MSKLRLNFERAYRLRPRPSVDESQLSRIRVDGSEGSQTILLPLVQKLDYLVVPTGGSVRSIASEDFRAERLGMLPTLWARMRLRLLFKKRKYLQFPEFSLFSVGLKHRRKRFTSFNQHMFNTGVALDGELLASYPELLQGWKPAASPRQAAPLSPGLAHACAIVAHVYYEDTWPDIAGVLMRLTLPFDLIVTTAPGRERLVEAVKRDFPDADVRVVENRGRDIRPFLDLLESGRLDRYRYVCKIHGKKSDDAGRIAFMGALWRRRSFFEILGGPGIAETIVRAFDADAGIGMIGPRAFRLPNASIPLEPAWGETRPKVLELARKMGVEPEAFHLDFFAGTMFWVRPEALKPLRALKLAPTFPEEQGLVDGGLEHATERLFATAVVAAGYRLADADGRAVYEDEANRGVLVNAG